MPNKNIKAALRTGRPLRGRPLCWRYMHKQQHGEIMARLVFLISVMFTSIYGYAYEGSPSEQVAQFFTELRAGKNSQAIDNLYSSNSLMSQKPQQLTMLKQQIGSIAPLYGSLSGSENIHTEQLSPSLVRIVELAKHNNHPIVWEFYFYKPNGKWIISQGTFNDQFQSIGATKGM